MCKSTYESLSSRPLGSRSAGGESELSWVSDYAIARVAPSHVFVQFASVLHALALLLFWRRVVGAYASLRDASAVAARS